MIYVANVDTYLLGGWKKKGKEKEDRVSWRITEMERDKSEINLRTRRIVVSTLSCSYAINWIIIIIMHLMLKKIGKKKLNIKKKFNYKNLKKNNNKI